MKILLLACLTQNKCGNTFGGAEKSIINLANWLAQKGYSVTLASVEGSVKAFSVDENVNFIGYDIRSNNKLYTHFQMLKNTQKVFSEIKPNVVISFWIHPMFYLLLNPLTHKTINIYSERNDPYLEYGRISRCIRSIVMKKVSGIVFQTTQAKLYFPQNIQKKGRVIHNPVYIQKSQYEIPNQRDNRIVSVGRLTSQKNFLLLIDAFKDILEYFPDLHLEIYGEGPLHKELQEEIESKALQAKVILMGGHSDVLNRIYGSRLFVLTSNYEGMPNALMEAMCLGIPVVSSDCPCGGPRELITDGTNGYLFEVGNQKELVKKMKIALENPAINDLVLQEKQLCVTHAQDEIFKQWIDFLNELTKKQES